jgi:hypothetical protein
VCALQLDAAVIAAVANNIVCVQCLTQHVLVLCRAVLLERCITLTLALSLLLLLHMLLRRLCTTDISNGKALATSTVSGSYLSQLLLVLMLLLLLLLLLLLYNVT